MKPLNKSGSLLVVATVFLYVIIMMSACVALVCSHEISFARSFYSSKRAFWMAEAGINMYMKDPALLEASLTKEINYADGKIILTRDDSQPAFRYIRSSGIIGDAKKNIQITYRANIPEVYKNSLSSKSNVTINGGRTTAFVNGQVLIHGEVIGGSKNADVFFESIAQNTDESLTTLNFSTTPGSSDMTYDNFKEQMKNLTANYPKDQITNVQSNDFVVSANTLKGKKIIFVDGNVTINDSSVINANQNVTIIATGTVTYNQNGEQSADSQLNIIAYGGYIETVSQPSSFRGLIYTHGSAKFDNIKAASVNTGSIIADGGIVLGNIWSTKIFKYADMIHTDQYPPGFELFTGGSIETPVIKPVSWKEIWN